jgi:hypothetical protein
VIAIVVRRESFWAEPTTAHTSPTKHANAINDLRDLFMRQTPSKLRNNIQTASTTDPISLMPNARSLLPKGAKLASYEASSPYIFTNRCTAQKISIEPDT